MSCGAALLEVLQAAQYASCPQGSWPLQLLIKMLGQNCRWTS